MLTPEEQALAADPELGNTRRNGDITEIKTVDGWKPFFCTRCISLDDVCPACGCDPKADTGELIFGKE